MVRKSVLLASTALAGVDDGPSRGGPAGQEPGRPGAGARTAARTKPEQPAPTARSKRASRRSKRKSSNGSWRTTPGPPGFRRSKRSSRRRRPTMRPRPSGSWRWKPQLEQKAEDELTIRTRLATLEQSSADASWIYDFNRATIRTADSRFQLAFRGRFQFDSGMFFQDSDLPSFVARRPRPAQRRQFPPRADRRRRPRVSGFQLRVRLRFRQLGHRARRPDLSPARGLYRHSVFHDQCRCDPAQIHDGRFDVVGRDHVPGARIDHQYDPRSLRRQRFAARRRADLSARGPLQRRRQSSDLDGVHRRADRRHQDRR